MRQLEMSQKIFSELLPLHVMSGSINTHHSLLITIPLQSNAGMTLCLSTESSVHLLLCYLYTEYCN